jgi:hypothetical protein
LRVDDRMDFGREPASGATKTMISISHFCRRSLLVRPEGSAVDHLDAAIWATVMASIMRFHAAALRQRTKQL